MHGDEVRLKLAVWVCEYTTQMRHQLRWPAVVRAEVESRLVVVVGMQVVPDRHRSLHNLCHFLYTLNGDVSRNDPRPCHKTRQTHIHSLLRCTLYYYNNHHTVAHFHS